MIDSSAWLFKHFHLLNWYSRQSDSRSSKNSSVSWNFVYQHQLRNGQGLADEEKRRFSRPLLPINETVKVKEFKFSKNKIIFICISQSGWKKNSSISELSHNKLLRNNPVSADSAIRFSNSVAFSLLNPVVQMKLWWCSVDGVEGSWLFSLVGGRFDHLWFGWIVVLIAWLDQFLLYIKFKYSKINIFKFTSYGLIGVPYLC